MTYFEQNPRVKHGQVREPQRSTLFYVGACVLFGLSALALSYLQEDKSEDNLGARVGNFMSRTISLGTSTGR